ncbi:MAG: response regulator [bacterium]|nr:response regulator [bacterium]
METKNSVLVVDDEPGICKTLKMLFEKKWYEVNYVMTGKEAIKKIRKRKFNIALLDIKLPDMEGTKLISIFKKIHPDIKIVMITGHSTKANVIESLNSGVSYYFEKPFNIEELLTKTHELIEEQNKTSFQRILQEATKSKNVHNMVKLDKQDVLLPQDLPFKIQKAIEYIEKNFRNPDLCSKKIASSVNLHPKRFSFLWNTTTKVSLPDFINDIRIENAKKSLIETTDYTSQIAHSVGFDSHNFNRVFKAKMGTSPIKYRNSYSQKFPT